MNNDTKREKAEIYLFVYLLTLDKRRCKIEKNKKKVGGE